MNNDKPASESVAALSEEDRKRINIYAKSIANGAGDGNADFDDYAYEIAMRAAEYEHRHMAAKQAELIAENERLKDVEVKLRDAYEYMKKCAENLERERDTLQSENAELRKSKVVFENCTFSDKELQSENARLREVLEGVLRLEDLIRYPDTVLPAQHQGEAEAINLMLDKIKAALTTTPKP